MNRVALLLLLVLGAPRAIASFDEGMALYQDKNYAAAFAEFRRLAEIGNHEAQFNVGVMYYRGEAVDRDPIPAYAWMSLANQDENPNWKRLRDLVYAGLPQSQKTVADAAREDLFARLSDGALEKQLAPVLAIADNGLWRPRETKRVAPTYPEQMLRERKFGSVEVSYTVAIDGTTRLHGIVWATDPEFGSAAVDAVKRFRYRPAQFNGKPVEEYGRRIRFVFKLDGGQIDRRFADRQIADLHDKAEKGSAEEAYRYGSTLELLSNFISVPDNPNAWYWKAAKRGSSAAQFSLGNNLLYGNACTADPSKGVQWLRRAAEAGQSEAQYVLAIEMLSGARLAPDRDAALKWLQRAAAANFAPAELKLAWLYATSADQGFRNPATARGYLKQIPDKFLDRLSLLEVRAAVAAASGNFPEALGSQRDAIAEATRYDLPTEALLSRLRAYQEGKAWVDPT